MSLRAKISLILAVTVAVMGGAASLLTGYLVSSTLRRGLNEEGLAVSRAASSQLAYLIVEDNALGVAERLRSFLEQIPDVRYGYVIGFDGEVVAHTFGAGFPAGLLEANVIPKGDHSRVRRLDVGGEIVSDIGFRVISGTGAEVHLGRSEKGIVAKVRSLRRVIHSLSLAAILLSAMAWLYATARLTWPLEALARQADSFGASGEYTPLPVVTSDEVGRLTASFNLMARRLTESVAGLEESEKRYRTLVEVALEGVATIDAAERITFVNDRLLEMMGYARPEALGRRAADFFFPDGLEQYAHNVAKLKAGRRTRFETALRRKDGSRVEVILSATPTLDQTGGYSGAVAMITDITDRLLAEEQLRAAKEGLERQNEELKKVDRIKDGLVRDVTHELKTPVAKLAMQLELLKEQMQREGFQGRFEEVLRVLEGSVRRQEEAIRNILSLSRLEGGGRRYRLESLRLDQLLQEVLGDYAEALSSHGFEVDSDLRPMSVHSDREMLWHVFSNLINNAIKFRRRDATPRLKVTLLPEREVVAARVEDNGIGLESSEQSRVFDRFYQACASVEGTGVGLTIARRIVEDLGGTITFESKGPGQGAVVSVMIPGTGGGNEWAEPS